MFTGGDDPTKVIMLVRFGEQTRNSGNSIHGGAIFAVFDHTLIQSSVLAHAGSFVLTASLSVEYLLPVSPLPTGWWLGEQLHGSGGLKRQECWWSWMDGCTRGPLPRWSTPRSARARPNVVALR